MQQSKFVYKNRNAASPAMPAPIMLCFAAPASVRPAPLPVGNGVCVGKVVDAPPAVVEVDMVEGDPSEPAEVEEVLLL